jgi:hypothetical protein
VSGASWSTETVPRHATSSPHVTPRAIWYCATPRTHGLLLLLLHHRTSQRDDEISLSLAAAAVAFFGNWAGARMKLDYSAKLFIMTFLLVTFGAQQDSESKLLLVTKHLASIHLC